MSQQPDTSKKTETLRSDIDTTRRHIDETIDALAARLQGRHLFDEFLNLVRHRGGGARLKQKVSSSTNSVVHAVADAVRAHPLPTLLMGAGAACLLYERSEQHVDGDEDYDPALAPDDVDPLAAGERVSGIDEPEHSRLERGRHAVGDATRHAGERAREAAERATEQARKSARSVRRKVRATGARVQDRAHDAYSRGRETAARSIDEHPLEAGLVSLALGLIAGLAAPVPRAVDEMAGPTSDRFKERVRETATDLAERGGRVVQSAAEAARHEAREQGFTSSGTENAERSDNEDSQPEDERRPADASEPRVDRESHHAAEPAREEAIKRPPTVAPPNA